MDVSIILNGEIKNGSWLKRRLRGAVIAVDGGANTCRKFGIIPKYVIGDFDSVSKASLFAFKKTSNILYDASQQSTDFEKSLFLAQRLNAKTISVFGGYGGEFDHEIANILSLTPACIMVDEKHTARVVKDRLNLRGKSGDLVSVIALSDVRGLSYSGLKWSAPTGKVHAGWLGVRNRLQKTNAVIRVQQGRVAVIIRTS